MPRSVGCTAQCRGQWHWRLRLASLPVPCLVTLSTGAAFTAGLMMAIYNLAGNRAKELVTLGLFSTTESVCAYFIDPFPWLVLEVQEAAGLCVTSTS